MFSPNPGLLNAYAQALNYCKVHVPLLCRTDPRRPPPTHTKNNNNNKMVVSPG